MNVRNHILAVLSTVVFLTYVFAGNPAKAAATDSQAPIGASGAAMPRPDSWDRILAFMDYTSRDMTPEEIAAHAPDYVSVWSGMSWQVDSFRNSNPGINFGRYIPAFLDDHNARPDPVPEHPEYNTPERRERTMLWWNTEVDGVGHPDWVLYTCDGVTPPYWADGDGVTFPNMPLDFTNPDVIDWQVRNMGEDTQRDYTAVSADLVYLRNFDHACGIYRNGEWVQLFTGEEEDPVYAAAVVEWARQMRARLHSLPQPKGLVANFPPFGFYSDEEILELTANLDGILDESGFTAFGLDRVFISGEWWFAKVRNIIAMQQQGVAVYSQNYVNVFPPPLEELDWILSSFLMAKENSEYISVTIVGIPDPIIRWPYLSVYEKDVGHPCAPMMPSQNVYVRDYSNGIAIANPSWASGYVFTLPPGNFRDLHDFPIVGSTLVLPPVTGKVLLSDEARCP